MPKSAPSDAVFNRLSKISKLRPDDQPGNFTGKQLLCEANLDLGLWRSPGELDAPSKAQWW